MRFATAKDYVDEIHRRAIEKIPTYLPEDHHSCIPKLVSGLAAQQIDDPMIEAALVSEDHPEEVMEALSANIARNLAGYHMTAYAQEQQQRAGKGDVVSDLTWSFGPLLWRRIEYRNVRHRILYLGRACRFWIDFGVKK